MGIKVQSKYIQRKNKQNFGQINCLNKDLCYIYSSTLEIDVYKNVYFSSTGDPQNQFSISPLSSNHGTVLSRITSLDREITSRYSLVIEAVNQQLPNDPVTQTIYVNVVDENDNWPIFEKEFYNVTLSEDLPVNSHIIKVTATDADTGVNAEIVYRIIPGTAREVFVIDSKTGEIKLAKPLNRELRDSYVLFIEAQDGVFANYTELDIAISDVNEHKPYFLEKEYQTLVMESIGQQVPIITLLAKDEDTGPNAEIVYTIFSGDPDGLFTIDSSGVLMITKSLDYEKNSSFVLTVEIEDSGTPPLKGDNQATITLGIINTNDNRPVFSKPEYHGFVKENSLEFKLAPFQVYAQDPDGGRLSFIKNKLESPNLWNLLLQVHLLNTICPYM